MLSFQTPSRHETNGHTSADAGARETQCVALVTVTLGTFYRKNKHMKTHWQSSFKWMILEFRIFLVGNFSSYPIVSEYISWVMKLLRISHLWVCLKIGQPEFQRNSKPGSFSSRWQFWGFGVWRKKWSTSGFNGCVRKGHYGNPSFAGHVPVGFATVLSQ